MQKRKVTVEVEIDDGKVNSIEDIEREILAQNILKQVAIKYLESLQDDLSQKVDVRKGSKKVHIKTPLHRSSVKEFNWPNAHVF
jgi:hypothetical protein